MTVHPVRGFTVRALALLALAALMGLLVTPPARADPVTDAIFTLHCTYSHSLPDDPIVYPGVAGASHAHDFMGNDSANAFSTYDSMRASTTRCLVSADTAGYWVPALFTAAGTQVTPTGMNLYYRNGPGGSTAFPPDFRIVARGGPDFGWACGGVRPFLPTIPDCTGQLPIRSHITFPSCWDGVQTHSDDTSHVTWADVNTLACPAGFGIRLPRIQLNVSYGGIETCFGCYLSSGAPSTFHSDFWNTWDQSTLEHLVAKINAGVTCHDLRDGAPCLEA